jgi:hypothetical protein
MFRDLFGVAFDLRRRLARLADPELAATLLPIVPVNPECKTRLGLFETSENRLCVPLDSRRHSVLIDQIKFLRRVHGVGQDKNVMNKNRFPYCIHNVAPGVTLIFWL